MNPNTHNLGWVEDVDGSADGEGRVGPGAVGCAFDVVAAHLAAYDAGVGAQSPLGEQSVEEFVGGAADGGGEVDGGGQPGADAASGGVEGFGERDPVWVDVVVVGGGVDECAERVVHAQVMLTRFSGHGVM